MPETRKTDFNPKCGDLEWIFSLNQILSICKFADFELFLSKEKIKSSKEIFNGFVFFSKTIARSFLEEMSRGWSFNLKEDLIISRAMNRGIQLSKIKNSCQKTIFLKNLQEIFDKWWNSKTPDDFSNNYNFLLNKIIQPINQVFEENIEVSEQYKNYSKNEIVRRLICNYALVSLHDTDGGFPKGYFFSLSKMNLTDNYLSSIFNGYKISLIYLWKKFLREVDADDTDLLEKIKHSKNWNELDSFFEDINLKFISPIEKDFRLILGLGDYFRIVKSISPKIFDHILFKKPEEPKLSKKENLQQTLLWYPIQALSGSGIFTGVSAFSSVLAGSVRMKQLFKIDEKSLIIRFKHAQKYGNNYSYALLIEAFGTVADYSGWLIFYNCCNDYSGFAGSEHQFAENIINVYKDNNSIKVINYNISLEDFLII